MEFTISPEYRPTPGTEYNWHQCPECLVYFTQSLDMDGAMAHPCPKRYGAVVSCIPTTDPR